MHIKTMEGIAGADTNRKLMAVPMRVYKEAERRGDTQVMERAMGYVSDFSHKADDYVEKAEEGMKEEAEKLREQAKEEAEKATEERTKEKKSLEESASESSQTDMAQISAEGRALARENMPRNLEESAANEERTEKEPVIYTKAGEAVPFNEGMGCQISISG